MANYVLSCAAEQSLEEIYIYTHDQHGPAQAADEFRPGPAFANIRMARTQSTIPCARA